jgi:tetratricopeptide (TPR) repeat protein
MKLVAGLTGASLDTLVQRDAQARVRRVTAITVAALIAMLAMALLLVVALRARSEADRQRAKAEGLVEYMLTDLREKLKGVGRLDVMTAVNERAMAYYGDQQSLEGLPPESLDRRARILHAMGEDDEKRGRLDKALVKFKEAHRTTAAVLAKKPDDPDAIFAHAQSEYWVGYAEQLRERYEDALGHYDSYLTLANRFAEFHRSTGNTLRDVGWAHNARGVVLLNGLKRPAEAKKDFESYLSIFGQISDTRPGDKEAKYSVADAHAWLADASFAMQDYPDSVRHRRAQINVLDKLIEGDPRNDVFLLQRVAAIRSVFRGCYRLQDRGCAVSALKAATEQMNGLNYDRANRDWVRQDAYISIDRGFLSLMQADRRGAREFLAQARPKVSRYAQMSSRDDSEISQLKRAFVALEAKAGS